jgi:Flp pilus assembly protein TadG
MRHRERGQALIETAIFLPVALLVLFGMLYFGRYGVLAERVQAASRYGALVAFDSSSAYSAGDIYAAIASGGITPKVCPSTIVPSTIAAVSEQTPGATASPSPYWQPDTPATATCAQSTVSFGGASWASYHTLTVTKQSVSASIVPPPFLGSLVGGSLVTATASFAYVRSDPPDVIMYCTVGTDVSAALGFSYAGGSC